ncbi:2-oxoglutarate ferredoxin oxidoreductase subunit alpha [candidate division TA06 bacterium DG_26]|uniref:2-oxoglutarate ferredoxin oxidoreductase subunit alpha n=1 Tax=candidate division TA06 bacterium DG_26 TaxID=1703771 RepID=A0A0S7WL38_UNCT6|nr:MAG: 2-oxoglutarate ferredoxin oxidoreductase subunit alpha [candidate division TA06 bacterium DG_26]
MRKPSPPRTKMMQGNEACVEGAIAAGVGFFAGYPITPSSEIAELMAEKLPQRGGVFIQMEDEIGAMGAVIGASLAGAKAMTATSGPGFSLKQENLGYASMTEVPCVIVNVQRGGPSTGLPTLPSQGDVMQARWGAHGDHPVIALVASSVEDTFNQTVRSFSLAEQYRVPVVLLLDEIVGHVNEKARIPSADEIEVAERKKPTVPPDQYHPYEPTESDIPPMANFGEGFRFHVTGLSHDRTGFPTNDPKEIDQLIRRINRKVDRYRDDIIECREYGLDDARLGVFAYGSTARSARRAAYLARQEGIKVGLLEPLVLWPFPEAEVFALAQKVSHIIVPEMNLGQIAHEVRCSCRGKAEVQSLTRVDGELIRPAQILEEIREISR